MTGDLDDLDEQGDVTAPSDGDELVRVLERDSLKPWFLRSRIVIPEGLARTISEWETRDTLVLVQRGRVRVVCGGGAQRTFGPGAALAPGWVGAVRLESTGPGDACLLVVGRRSTIGDVHD